MIGVTVCINRPLRSWNHPDRPIIPAGVFGTVTEVNGTLARVEFDPEALPGSAHTSKLIPLAALEPLFSLPDLAVDWDLIAAVQREAAPPVPTITAYRAALQYRPVDTKRTW